MSYVYPFQSVGEETKRAVWNKGREIPDYDPDVWRWDICGKPIKYAHHGNTNSEHGWEIDHIHPTALSGDTTLDNLQPLQWENNRSKGDNHPSSWSCP